MNEIGDRLKALLESRKYNPRRLASATGISESVLSRILNYNTKPHPANFK